MTSFRFDIQSEKNGKPKIEKLYSFKKKLGEIAHGFETCNTLKFAVCYTRNLSFAFYHSF
jgi:hypothetical protein